MKWFSRMIVVGVMVLVAVALYMNSNKPIPADVAVAQEGRIESYIEERAKTRLPKIYQITMPSAGRVLPITLEEGTRVAKGEVVAWMDPKDLHLAVAEVEARVARIEAEIAENDDTRLENSALEQANLLLESVEKTVESAQEQTRAGKALFDLATTELERIQRLYDTNASSKEELQRAEVAQVKANVDYQKDLLSLRSNEAIQKATQILPIIIRQYIDKKGLKRAVLEKQRAEAIAQYEKAKRDQDQGSIESPVDGVVLARLVSNERVLPAGEVLLEIGQPEQLEVEVEILSEDAVNVRKGNPVEIHGAAIGVTSLTGVVDRIYPAGFKKISSLGVEQQRVLVIVRFNKEDPGVLSALETVGPEYRVRVRIITNSKEKAVWIPRTALVRTVGGSWEVFVVSGGFAERRDVTLGISNDREAEILTGVQAGEQVLLAPDSSITGGQPIDPKVLDEVP